MRQNHPLRQAWWVWPGNFYRELINCHAQFRRDFRLPRVPRKAPFFITADQAYALYVNGRYVGRGPARGYQASWPYDEYDLAPHLVRGHNWISVQAYNAGISNYQYVHQGAAGFLCAARWGRLDLASSTAWQMRLSPAHRQMTERLSKQINFQEHVDARLDDQSWIRSPRPPANWPPPQPTHVVWRRFGSMPWPQVEPRGIPNLGNTLLAYERTCTATRGRCGADWRTWPNVSHGLFGELERLKWKAAPPARAKKDGLIVTLPASGPERLAAVSLRLAEPSIGTLIVEATGAGGGETIDFFFCEGLKPDGSPILIPKDQACGASMAARLILRPGRTRHEFFQMIGHRYVVAIARGTGRPVTLKLALRETVYPLHITGSFQCGDQVLNDIYRISVRTQRSCSLDAFVDTPWREQAQWWGDARVQCQNTFHLSGDTRLMVRGIRSIARQEVPNGLTYGHAPTVAYHCVLPDFSIIWVLTIWDYYWQTGDLSLFLEQWPRIQQVLGYFTGEGRGKNGLLRFDQRYWLFLDWCDIYKEGTPAMLNLWYLFMLEKLAALAAAARMNAARARFQKMYRQQKRLVLARLWDRKAGLFRDGLKPDSTPVNVHSIHTQTLAIMCGLRPKEQANLVARRLLPYLRSRKVPGALPSSYWVTYVYDVMRRLGYAADVVRHIRKMWAPMIPFGGTFETFVDLIGQSSASHAWAAHPIYHLVGTLGGVAQKDKAWRHVAFAPLVTLSEADRARVTVPTPRGLIRASWQRRSREAHVSLSLPKGITADVQLPGLKPSTVTGRRHWVITI